MEQNQFAFHLEEYRSLKQELLSTIKNFYQAALLSIAGNAALISFWLNSHDIGQRLPASRILIPLLSVTICIFGILFYRLRRRSVGKIVGYLKLLEHKLRDPDLGWESFYQSDIDKRFFFVRTPFVIYSLFAMHFILVTLFATTVIAG